MNEALRRACGIGWGAIGLAASYNLAMKPLLPADCGEVNWAHSMAQFLNQWILNLSGLPKEWGKSILRRFGVYLFIQKECTVLHRHSLHHLLQGRRL